MSRLDAFEGILASLHRATLDDAHWPATAGLTDEAVGASGNALVVGERAADDVSVYFVRHPYLGESHDDRVRAYFDTYRPSDERLPLAGEGAPLNLPSDSAHFTQFQ